MIIPFVGRDTLEARENLASLIEHAQTYRFFHGSKAVDWKANSWDLRPFYSKVSSTPVGLTAHFTNLETTRRGPRAKEAIDLREPFLSAAKALTTEFLRTSGENSPSRVIATLRAVEQGFRDFGQIPDICDLTPTILDRAQEILVASYADAWSYGRLLERLAIDYINPARISRIQLTWRTSVQYQAPLRNDHVNADGARGNTHKLPNIQAVFELAGVFHDSTYVPDLVVTAWFALAMFAPSRATEILGLPLNCETEAGGQYGLSWRPLKDGDPMTKFAVTQENAEIARIAIQRLLELGEKARIAHKWYESNPGRLFLPPQFEYLRGQPVTLWEASQIIGRSKAFPQGNRYRNALQRCGTTREFCRGGPGASGAFFRLYTFESLETFVIQSLPQSFPYIDPRNKTLGSDALFCSSFSSLHRSQDRRPIDVTNIVEPARNARPISPIRSNRDAHPHRAEPSLLVTSGAIWLARSKTKSNTFM